MEKGPVRTGWAECGEGVFRQACEGTCSWERGIYRMNKIVDMQEKLEGKKQKEQLEKYRGRVETIQKIVQCSSCHFRCAMCGLQVGGADSVDKSLTGLALCEGCKSEFEEYLAISRGKKTSDVFWHNREWLEIWSAWLSYRRAINAFTASREFKLLVEELTGGS
jgi:hypothetical protein